jgi:hypothetical protein
METLFIFSITKGVIHTNNGLNNAKTGEEIFKKEFLI